MTSYVAVNYKLLGKPYGTCGCGQCHVVYMHAICVHPHDNFIIYNSYIFSYVGYIQLSCMLLQYSPTLLPYLHNTSYAHMCMLILITVSTCIALHCVHACI